MHRVIVALLGLLYIPSPAAGQLQAPACMDLSVGDWSPAMDLGADSLYLAPPPRVYFDTVAHPAVPTVTDGSRLVPARGALPSVHRIARWSSAADGRIEVIWSNGFSGLRGNLQREGNRWVGQVRSFWDFGRATQVAPISGIVVSCDLPLPLEHQMRYSYIRGILLEGGDSLRLGEPLLPTHAGLLPGAQFSYAYDQKVSGDFAGAGSLRATVDDLGRVRDIRLQMPESCSTLAGRLEARIGAPTSRAPARMSMTSWFSRTVSLSLIGNDPQACRIMLRDPSAR